MTRIPVKLGRAIVALAVGLMVAAAHPVRAHHGYSGPVRLYLETVRLDAPEGDWQLRVGVNDAGTGQPAPGFVVEASGSSAPGAAFGPLRLADPDADGRYDAALGALPAGDWSFTVNVTDAPDSDERAVPLTRTWNVTVPAGQSLELIDRQTALDAPESSGSGAGGVAGMLRIAGLAALAGAAVVFVRRRRRSDHSGAGEPASRARARSSSTVHWS